MCCITLARFLTDHLGSLPVSVPRQLLDHLDLPMVLVPLMEAAPWQRRSSKGIEKYVEGQWLKIERKDRLRLSKLEAQVWLTLYNLLMDQRWRSLYEFTNYRKDVLVRLKRYLNDILKDQLPLLKDLQRLLEELSLMKMPAAAKPLHLITPVASIRESVYRTESGKEREEEEWKNIALELVKSVFAENSKDRQEEMRALAEVYSGGAIDALLEDPKCSECGSPATKRCSSCESDWYCGRKCQVKAWKRHKPLCKLLTEATKRKAKTHTASGSKDKIKNKNKNSLESKAKALIQEVKVEEVKIDRLKIEEIKPQTESKQGKETAMRCLDENGEAVSGANEDSRGVDDMLALEEIE